MVNALAGIAETISVTTAVTACRDPRDDKFLSLAFAGEADLIITGDDDLLVLHPFQGVSIVTPRQFLDSYEGVCLPFLSS